VLHRAELLLFIAIYLVKCSVLNVPEQVVNNMRTWQHIPFTMSASRQFDLWQEIENEITAAVFLSFFVTHIRLRMRKLWMDLVQGES